jgi:predicted XRE-type DNA-binding protein
MKRDESFSRKSVETSSGNIYTDLGYPNSQEMMVKARLSAEIGAIIKRRGLTQERAAEILGLTQSKVSRMLRGQFRGISERRLLDCLTRLGRDVQIVVRPAPRNRDAGRLTVHVA